MSTQTPPAVAANADYGGTGWARSGEGESACRHYLCTVTDCTQTQQVLTWRYRRLSPQSFIACAAYDGPTMVVRLELVVWKASSMSLDHQVYATVGNPWASSSSTVYRRNRVRTMLTKRSVASIPSSEMEEG
ncbi:hypothetical protein HGRIS_000243 [Hohenbuehelia grisea]|uniref:Uncharacterized protein n=1 Tax=Hohenbuehelia grisea TaxID=104357 RepID=A0ABR3JQG8_9AGAR